MAQATFGRILRQVLSNVIYLRISGYHLRPKSSYKEETSVLREECECKKYILVPIFDVFVKRGGCQA